MKLRALARLVILAATIVAPYVVRAADAVAPEKPAIAEVKPSGLPDFFRPGEALTFRLGYGIFSNAGTMHIETIREETPEGPRIRVVVKTATQGMVDSFYSLNNTVVSLIDAETGRPLQIATTGNASSRKTDETTVFDYETKTLVHTDSVRAGRSGTAPLPDEPVYDIIVTMMGARVWNLKAGESKDVIAPFGHDFYKLKVTALREDTIKTPVGKFKVVVLEPKQQGELRGLFKKGGGFKFYISTGDKPQIVRLDIVTKWGSIVGVLEKIEKKEAPPADEKSKPAEKTDANPRP